MKFYLDLETYSPTPINCGTYKYSELSEIMIFACAIDNGPVHVIDFTDKDVAERESPKIRSAILKADEIYAHNSQFDRIIMERHGWIGANDHRWRDTFIRALAHGLPGGLGMLSDLLNLPVDKAKDKSGRKLIHLFCKPRPDGTRATGKTHPIEWAQFLDYAGLDIEALRELDRKLPVWNDTQEERKLWRLDRKINDRGVRMDVELAQAAVTTIVAEKKSSDKKISAATEGDVGAATQRDALIKHIEEAYNITLPDLKKSTVERRLNDPELPEAVKDLLRLRLIGASTATSKYKAALKHVSSDGRMRGNLQFCGASRTGRWSGRGLQMQNLPRPTHKQKEIEGGISAIKGGYADLVYEHPSKIASSAIRGLLVCDGGGKLVVADLASIEGRVLAWLAGEDYKLEAYREIDKGVGFDMYVRTYAKTFSFPVEDVDKDQRQLGKTLELALGYNGGVGALVTFSNGFNIDLDQLRDVALPHHVKQEAGEYWAYCQKEGRTTHGLKPETFIACDAIKRAWREGNPATVKFWKALQEGATDVLCGKARYVEVGKVRFDRVKNWLRIQLPSGRYLCYAGAHLVSGSKIVYRGVNQYSRKWGDIPTYGGKLCILEGTNVLTKRGWVRIETVTSEDRMWDGVEWVPSDGAVCNGAKEVIEAHGVWMTPDHMVLTKKGWCSASQSKRYRRATCRLPYSYKIRGVKRTRLALDLSLRLWQREILACLRHGKAETARGNSVVRVHEKANPERKADDTRHVAPPRVRSLAQHVRSLPATLTSGVVQLWRSGYKGVQELAEELRTVLEGHGAHIYKRLDVRPGRQLKRILAGQLPVDRSQDAGAKHAQVTTCTHTFREDKPGGAGGEDGDLHRNDILSNVRRLHAGTTDRETGCGPKVYDVLNCGPRHRFVVQDKWGKPLIVHNCENVTQAVARDVLAHGMIGAEDAGYRVVLSVHDELLTETPDTVNYTHEDLSDIMSINPSWATGLPLAAEGFESYRYRKG